ncbi:YkvA family protein [Cyanobium sp. ATX 6A2]|uniref:YkvA family protein n=1 Tax=Cyanobium sp. ATX 6A2 TaxID=2823700 RepID=UPI0037BE3655
MHDEVAFKDCIPLPQQQRRPVYPLNRVVFRPWRRQGARFENHGVDASRGHPMSAANTELVAAPGRDFVAINEGLLKRLLRRAGRTLARPAIQCFEMAIDSQTPHKARLTMLAALTYLLVPLDLIPDFIPVAGFSDDLMAITALLGLCTRYVSPQIRERAEHRLNQWFPQER